MLFLRWATTAANAALIACPPGVARWPGRSPASRSWAAALIFGAVGVIGGIEPADARDAATSAAAPAPRELIAGVPRSWPPHYGVDKNGEPAGFAIDIMDEIAARADLRVTYRVMDSFAEVAEAMNAGEIDLIPNSGITPGRLAKFSFTAPVETSVISIFVRRGELEIRKTASLAGHRVAVVDFNIGQTLMKDREDIDLVVHRDVRTALFALLAGRVEALIYPKSVVLTLARQIGVEDRIKVVGAPLRELKRGIRVQKGDTKLLARLNRAVDGFVGTPAYQAIYVKWYGNPTPFWTVSRASWILGGLVAAVLILMGWWRYRTAVRLNRELRLAAAERERAERAREESDERLRDVAEVGSDWIWEMDSDLRFSWVSRRIEQVLHMPVSHYVGKTREELGAPDFEHETWQRHLDDLAAHRPFREFRFSRTRADGRKAHLVISGKPRFDAGGGFLGYRGTGRDATSEVQARQELTRIEDRFLKAMNSMPDSVALFDAKEGLVFCNKTFLEAAGAAAKYYTPGVSYEEHLRARISEGIVPDEGIGREEAWMASRIEWFRNSTDQIEVHYPDPGRWIQIRNVRLPDGETLMIVSDITDLKQREEALRKSDSRFRDFADAASDVIWETDSDLRYTYTSDRYYELTERTPDDIIGKSRTELLPHDDGESWVRHLDTLSKRLPYRDFVFSRNRPDGKALWFSSSAVPVLDSVGEFEGYRGTLKDITAEVEAQQALRESEQRYRALVQASPEPIWVHCEGRVVYGSPVFIRLMSARSEQEILTMNIDELVHPDDRELVFRRREQVLQSTGPLPPIQLRLRTLDGRTVLFETVSAPFRWRGRPAFVVIGRDITEQRQREEELRQAQKMEAVGQLTGGVAHDFNNLLSVILGNLELLDERITSNGELKGLVAPAIRAANRGGALTHRLLAFSRKQALAPTVTDLGEMVGGMTELLRRTLGEAVEVDVIGDHKLWHCEVDHAQLEAALLNLAINARDAMPIGGRLTIETRNVVRDESPWDAGVVPSEYVTLAVTDTGSGMAAEIAERAFDPFFSTKDVGKGSGLGLSMVYGFVKQSGGHTELHSVEGEGTRVGIFLPRVADDGSSAGDAAGASAEPQSNGETVLVVEDDPDVRTLTVALLEGLGYTVVDAANADEALSLLGSTTRVDLLLTDVVLPGGTMGPELAEKATRDRPGIGILFMSGYARDVLGHHDQSIGGVEVLQKPFRKADLARKVHAVLHQAAVESDSVVSR